MGALALGAFNSATGERGEKGQFVTGLHQMIGLHQGLIDGDP